MNYFATEVVRSIDDIKKIFLMCEYLNQVGAFNNKAKAFDLESLKKEGSLEKFTDTVGEFVSELALLVDSEIRRELEQGDYEVYTDDRHHRKYWNEIELPSIASEILETYKDLVGLNYGEGKSYCVDIYDLSDDSLYFNTESEMEEFLEVEDVAPFTAFQLVRTETGIHCEEIYSA